MEPELFALYGTLMSGEGGQERLGLQGRLQPRGPCVLAGTLVELGWYPGLVLEPAGRVIGELVRVADAGVLEVLDRYEGFDPASPERSLFVRTRLVTVEPGVEAWAYVFTGEVPDGRVIASGDWRAHRAAGPVDPPGPADTGGT
ncbi:gamma-glutamylcyclotransferase family protein [Rhabdothermincola sediminis]|uniref:gamma-glutamylcyclotransferase family protein n=1 Tax=Rhabdothermincola sediminis TaxID=2751370 RepID=UPI001AA00F5F|nr:gamma-glutamylcyclotransferase family protein [Rhabdothermincola sediminis]